MKRIFMALGFLVLLLSSLSARYIFDGKIIFSKHATNKDSLAYLIIEKASGVLDTFAIIDTLGNVYWKYPLRIADATDTTFITPLSIISSWAEHDSISTGVIWTLGGKIHYFVGSTGVDTAYIQMVSGAWKFWTNNQPFNFTGGNLQFDGHLLGYGDDKKFEMDGYQWYMDYDDDDAIAYIYFHGPSNEAFIVDSTGEVLEWTGRRGFKAKILRIKLDVSQITDTLAHIQADTSGIDRNVTALLINGESINNASDFAIKTEDKDGNVLFSVKGDGMIEGYNLNKQFAYQCAGDIFNIATNTVALLGWITPATTEQDLSPHNRDFDYWNFAASDRTAKGLVWKLIFPTDPANGYMNCPDHDDFTFDDEGGANGFTMGGWYKVVATASKQTIWSKWDESTGSEAREWKMYLDTDETLVMMLWDESVDADPYRTSDGAISTGWHLILAVYDGRGAGAENGITFYVDGVVEASTGTADLGYVGMENTTSYAYVGTKIGTGATATDCYQGDMGHQFITTDQLTADENWELYLRTRGYYNE